MLETQGVAPGLKLGCNKLRAIISANDGRFGPFGLAGADGLMQRALHVIGNNTAVTDIDDGLQIKKSIFSDDVNRI
jgi:hypothetical protein